MLKVENLSYSYEKIRVLYGISLEAKEKTITGVLGSNGAGKSTLLANITGILTPHSGSIYFKGKNITKLPAHKRAEEGLSLVPERRRLFGNMSVLENLKAGAYSKRARGKLGDSLEYVYNLFPILKERKNQSVSTMSGGEQQMVAIARGLMSSPSLLMMDEPLLGLQPNIRAELIKKLEEVSKSGVTILLVEQNFFQILKVINWGYVIETGRIALEGTPKQLKENKHVRKAYLGV